MRALILGAFDPEMEAIDFLAREHAEADRPDLILYAVLLDGRRVGTDTAHDAFFLAPEPGGQPLAELDTTVREVALVECGGPVTCCQVCEHAPHPRHPELTTADVGFPGGVGPCGDLHSWTPLRAQRALLIDPHEPGYLGYGAPPAQYWRASSLGQVCRWMDLRAPPRVVVAGREVDARIVAAADQCLGAAYRGECPGVDPGELLRWRAYLRAREQGREPAEVLADIEQTTRLIRAVPRLAIGGVQIADMRPGIGPPDRGGWGEVPELSEAAVRAGLPVFTIPRPDEDGRRELVLLAAPPQAVLAFLEGQGLARYTYDRYGDPARGFARGYLND